MADIPTLSDTAVIKLASLAQRSEELVDAIFFGSDRRGIEKAMYNLRELYSDHEIMALRLNLDRQGLLPEKR